MYSQEFAKGAIAKALGISSRREVIPGTKIPRDKVGEICLSVFVPENNPAKLGIPDDPITADDIFKACDRENAKILARP
jgi:hypothetical protein